MTGTDSDVTLVTGAAGGIGAAVVRALAREGSPVVAVDRDAEGLAALQEGPTPVGDRVRTRTVDVTRREVVDEAVEDIEATFGPIGSLVNAAGMLKVAPVLETDPEDWSETFAVNTTGVFLVTRAVVGRMVTRGRGAIVTVGSNAAATPRASMAAYAASKAATTMFVKSLGLEVAPFGIRCNVVAPGSTDTKMLHSMWDDEDGRARTVAGRPEQFRVGIPLGKLARPEDIADSILFLLSDAASHITLHSLTVDGGAALGA